MLRHKDGKLRADFMQCSAASFTMLPATSACRTSGRRREALSLVPGTEVEVVEGCSGRDGTYAVKTELH